MTQTDFYRWRPHPWHGLNVGPDAPRLIHAYVEITPHDLVKHEIDEVTGHLCVDRPQRTSSQPPTLYGFIPRTFCGTRVGDAFPAEARKFGRPFYHHSTIGDTHMEDSQVTTLFLDIGGVLLTNGWDHNMRRRACETFDIDYNEMNERHHLTFDTYEEGKLSLFEYLNRVIFYKQRPFSLEEFREYMFEQSQPFSDMIDLVCKLKERYRLKIAAVSNEGRELTVYRIQQFDLGDFIDFFISSCFVHYRKPDEDIYRIALDIAQVSPKKVVYVEDRPMFVEVANGLDIRGIVHTGYESTRSALEALGLLLEA